MDVRSEFAATHLETEAKIKAKVVDEIAKFKKTNYAKRTCK